MRRAMRAMDSSMHAAAAPTGMGMGQRLPHTHAHERSGWLYYQLLIVRWREPRKQTNVDVIVAL